MKSVLQVAILLILATVCLPALANPATSTEIGVLVGEASEVIRAWQVGTIAGLAAIVHLLTHLLRIPFLRNWLRERKLRWVIPHIALGLGVAGGVFAGLTQGQDWLTAIGTGILAGFAATGAHEAGKTRKAEKRQA